MNKKMITILLLATLVILVAAPASLATSQYNSSLNTVYPGGSCGTCHVNGTSDGPRTPYGISFEKQANHTTNASAALRAIGAPPTANVTVTPAATTTLTATPVVTKATATPAETTAAETPAATTKSPGFGIVVSIVGLLAWALIGRRKN